METQEQSQDGGVPQKSQQRRLQRGRMHMGVRFLGRWTAYKSAVFGNKMIFKEAVSAKWGGQKPGCGGLGREAGRQQVQSTCRENVTAREKRKRS